MTQPNAIASEILQVSAAGFAGYAASELLQAHPELTETMPSESFTSWKAHLTQRIMELAAALKAGEPDMFSARVRWTKRTFDARGISDQGLRASLEALQNVLRERLPGDASSDACDLIDGSLAAMNTTADESDSAALDPAASTDRLALQYIQQVLEGNSFDALDKILRLQADGSSIEDIYAEILLPAQREVGRLWHIGELAIAEEHLVTAATERVMTLLTHHAEASPSNGRTMIAAAASGNVHDIGLRAASDLFHLAGWRSLYLGSDIPLRELPTTLVYFDADVLLLGATLSTHVGPIERAIKMIRERCEKDFLIMVGGTAFNEVEGLWKKVGADRYARTIDDAVEISNEFFRNQVN